MKIAVLSPPWIPVPPLGYGGIERVVYNVVEGMVKKGHEVTLFSTGDSQINAISKFYYHKALGNDRNLKKNHYKILNHIYHFFKLVKDQGNFDIIHNHFDRVPLFFGDFINQPVITTIHNIPYNPDKIDPFGLVEEGKNVLLEFKDYPFVSISNKQRESLPNLNYVATIYNSIILPEFDFNPQGGEDLIWFGRIDLTKGIDIAIKAALALKKRLRASFFLDPGKKDYYETEIKPILTEEIMFNGEITTAKDKSVFLGDAKALLFPIRWDEPFGIVMIEAMAAGTPVIAFAKGSVPEVIKDGETGFIVNLSDTDTHGDWIIKKTGIDGMKEAIERIYTMQEDEYLAMRKRCRELVGKNFSIEKMVNDYENVYKQIYANHQGYSQKI